MLSRSNFISLVYLVTIFRAKEQYQLFLNDLNQVVTSIKNAKACGFSVKVQRITNL